MAIFEAPGAADALLDLMERERAAIFEGRFDSLDRLAAEKDRLGRAIAAAGPLPGVLKRLQDEAARNAALLAAMQTGVRRARERLTAARNPRQFSTYTKTGARVSVGPAAGALGKRA